MVLSAGIYDAGARYCDAALSAAYKPRFKDMQCGQRLVIANVLVRDFTDALAGHKLRGCDVV
jgi:hypothetical protein